MLHLPDFIGDLAFIMISAGIATILFKWLKQPVVLGYIVVGFFAGPYIEWIPTVADVSNISVWAEIGVIFLLFALGLEFSFKKLIAVGGTATIATSINLCSMVITGYILGQLLGWSHFDSIFLGGMLSMSSTIIIIKAFNDMGLQKQKFAGIVFGMLIVEDLAAILMMVLLSTLAVSRHFEGTDLVNNIIKLGFFMLIWFVVGIYMIPTILKRFKKYLNDETLLIVSVGLCLGMVLFAVKVGFSAALGAFIMGSILAETVEAKHIEHLTQPLKNLFGAVFFVSVGMMLNPQIIYDYALPIIIITAVVILGRTTFGTLGVIASGQGLRVAMRAGFSLSQIGEFSFIIATLGMSLGVINEILYPIIISVSIITTFTTPFCIKLAVPAYDFIEKRLPPKWNKLITGYAASSYVRVNKENDWRKLLLNLLRIMAIYSSISLAIVFTFERFITPFIIAYISNTGGYILAAILTIIPMAPFLRAMMMRKNKSIEFQNLWNNNPFNRGALISLIILRIILSVVMVLMVLFPLFPENRFLMICIAFTIVILIIFSNGFKQQSKRIEARFLENFNRKQIHEEERSAILPTVAKDLLSKDIHIEEIEIPQSSPSIGKTLRELNLRHETGINIVSIIRGNKKINIPGAEERLYPFDTVVVAGSDEELQKLISSIEDKRNKSLSEDIPVQSQISLSQYIIAADSPIIGKTIKEARISENTECMIIGIDRKDKSIINFTSAFTFEENDVLWLAGEKDKLASFDENIDTQNVKKENIQADLYSQINN